MDYLHSAAGEYLRGVLEYDPEDPEVHYVRPDVRQKYDSGELLEVFEALTTDDGRLRAWESIYPETTHGDLNFAMQGYDNVMEIVIPHDDATSGTVISLDREAGSDLDGFVAECMSRLE